MILINVGNKIVHYQYNGTKQGFIFVLDVHKGYVETDVCDGYFKSSISDAKLKLPHNNYNILGIVDECVNAPYSEKFSDLLVDKNDKGIYLNYLDNKYTFETAKESFLSLKEKLKLNSTDYILRDDSDK